MKSGGERVKAGYGIILQIILQTFNKQTMPKSCKHDVITKNYVHKQKLEGKASVVSAFYIQFHSARALHTRT